MKRKLVGIFVCMLMMTTCVVPVYGTASERNEKTPNIRVQLWKDQVQPPVYKRSLQDIISGKPLPVLEGTRPLLVILTSFIDKDPHANHTVEYFDEMLFGPRPSLSDYYSEVSYGKFTYTKAGILGWYNVNSTWSEFQNLTDEYVAQYITQAVTAADKEFNFAPYDINNDGYVKNDELTLIIIQPGSDSLFGAHGWGDAIPTNDDVIVEGEMSIVDEWLPLSAFTHELGHDLGLPDLYDYSIYDSVNNSDDSVGIGLYGLMGAGGGYSYVHMTAWSKIQLGWLVPTVITTNGTYTLHDVETHAEVFILCDLQHSASEYFLIENRNRGTSYDSMFYEDWWTPYSVWNLSNLPDEGILIYHIDDTQALGWWTGGLVNDIEEHKTVDVECSDSPSSHFIDADDLDKFIYMGDNLGDDTDLWDSTTYDFDDFSSPCNATWYDGTPSGCAIHDFSAIGLTMTMNISINTKFENNPPTTPTITGLHSWIVNRYQKYYISTTDPEGGVVYYYIDWGDGSNTGWIGPANSSAIKKLWHIWGENGTYSVRMKAKDCFGAESDWAYHNITISSLSLLQIGGLVLISGILLIGGIFLLKYLMNHHKNTSSDTAMNQSAK